MVRSREYIEERSIPIPVGRGCWLWLLSPGSHGYGQAWCPEKKNPTTAHRVAYKAFVGSIPRGMLVQHTCDNRWCVNPDHLRLGTDATNAEDKRRKGRAAKKLSTEDRRSIRALAQRRIPQRKIANIFGVTQKAVWLVLQQHRA